MQKRQNCSFLDYFAQKATVFYKVFLYRSILSLSPLSRAFSSFSPTLSSATFLEPFPYRRQQNNKEMARGDFLSSKSDHFMALLLDENVAQNLLNFSSVRFRFLFGKESLLVIDFRQQQQR